MGLEKKRASSRIVGTVAIPFPVPRFHSGRFVLILYLFPRTTASELGPFARFPLLPFFFRSSEEEETLASIYCTEDLGTLVLIFHELRVALSCMRLHIRSHHSEKCGHTVVHRYLSESRTR